MEKQAVTADGYTEAWQALARMIGALYLVDDLGIADDDPEMLEEASKAKAAFGAVAAAVFHSETGDWPTEQDLMLKLDPTRYN